MNNNFKKIFFSSLLTVLFIISNLVSLKYTNFLGAIIPTSFVTYPFTALCVLLLLDMFGKKEAYTCLTVTIFIQIFILLSYILVSNLGTQAIIPDMANEVNSIFRLDEVNILASLIAFMISNYLLVYIYDYFTIIGRKFFGVAISVVSSLIVYGLIYISISNYYLGFEILLSLYLSQFIVAVIMTVIVTILFYLLKEKDNIYDTPKVFVEDINIKTNEKKLKDKPILEVIGKIPKKNKRKVVDTKSKKANKK